MPITQTTPKATGPNDAGAANSKLAIVKNTPDCLPPGADDDFSKLRTLISMSRRHNIDHEDREARDLAIMELVDMQELIAEHVDKLGVAFYPDTYTPIIP